MERGILTVKFEVTQLDGFYTLSLAVQLRIPVFLWGPPGVGKTYTISLISRRLNKTLVKVIPSYREPVDFLGYPYPVGEVYTYLSPKWVKRVKEERNVVLFFDELSTSPPQVQNAVFRLVSEKVFGDDEPLPDEVSIVAAGNPQRYAWSAFNLTPPLANRFVHVDWTAGGISPSYLYRILKGKGLPDDIPVVDFERYRENLPKVFDLVFSFLMGVGEKGLLNPPAVGKTSEVRGFPTPRSWVDFCIPLVTAWEVCNLPVTTLLCLVEGCVGEEMGRSFVAYYLRVREEVPSPEEVLSGKVKIPTRADLFFFTVTSLLSFLSLRNEISCYNEFLKRLMEVAGEVPDDVLLVTYTKIEEWKRKVGLETESETDREWTDYIFKRLTY